MLVIKSPTAINNMVSKAKVVRFEECIKQLKLYFSDIGEVRNQLEKGKTIKTPYYEFKHTA